MSLKLKQKRKQKKKRRFCLKKWFDFECNTARKELTRQPSDQKHYNSSNSIRGVAREIPEPPPPPPPPPPHPPHPHTQKTL